MNVKFAVILLCCLLILTACVIEAPGATSGMGSGSTATPAATAGERVYAAIELTTNPWLWVSFTDPTQQVEIDAPEQYTITFTTDGTVKVKADCNIASGTYTADDNGSLTITLGPMTLAACPPDSRSDEFIKNLGFVAGFFFEKGFLYLDLMADGGTFQLGAAAESMSAANTLAVDALQNATYSGIDEEGPVTLTAGLYEGKPVAEGGAAPRVEYVNGGERFGDLDGDGVDDAAVLLVESAGGSGIFTYLAAQVNGAGQPVDAGAVLVGDRTQVKTVAIANGQIILEIITQGPNDALCCPTLKVRKSYALQAGQLAEVGSAELGQLSAADLNGTTWTLVALGADQPPIVGEPAVTISFQDGQLSGFGGCNRYTSSFTLDSENLSAIKFAPIKATRMACLEPIMTQETAYFAALGHALQWGYQVGQLALFYDNAGQSGTLLFKP